MSNESICMFIPSQSVSVDLTTINFVHEKTFFRNEFYIAHTHSINIVENGEGVLHTRYGDIPLRKGDLFISFSGQPFFVENKQDLSYFYITFLGTRANALMERLRLNPREPVYGKQNALLTVWQDAIKASNKDNADLISEGILLYSFSHICNSSRKNKSKSVEPDTILKIKRHIEENFSDPALSLNSISQQFSYHPKYISERFRKTVRVGFHQCLQSLRLEYAAQLIANGMKNVNEISKLCGYNDPLYFSKAFKKKMGLSPKQYIVQSLSKD